MAFKSVEQFMQVHESDRRQTTDRPRCGEMCRYSQNHLRCKKRCRLIIIITIMKRNRKKSRNCVSRHITSINLCFIRIANNIGGPSGNCLRK